MKSSIFIPKTINVGYQNRSDTYTGKLAYVIYYDEKGKLRKEASWNSWRDEKIPNEEFDNVPTSGFVLNKKVGDYDSGWNHRHAYCRIYDPRNFEFEITIENLLYILENANSIKGKGLEGEFVYGWDGKDLVLMPVESPDYKAINEYSNLVHNNECIKTRDLVLGATYLTKDNVEWIYMGRFDYYTEGYEWESNGKTVGSKDWYDIPDRSYGAYERVVKFPQGKYHWFAIKEDDKWTFTQVKSVPKNKLISCIDDKCTEQYADIFNVMEGCCNYSPYDSTKDVMCEMTLDEFLSIGLFDNGECQTCKFISSYDGEDKSYMAQKCYGENQGKHTVKLFMRSEKNRWCYGYSVNYDTTVLQPTRIEEIYNIMKPKYIQRYLANGRKYEKRYSLRYE